jgi:hypothetical protein
MKLLHDAFSRTYRPAAVEAQIPTATANRHATVLRRCAGTRDSVTVVAPCTRANRTTGPLSRFRTSSLLMLTTRRLVITTQSPILHRLHLHLNAELSQLADVTWTADSDGTAMHLALTAMDGVREHFWLRMGSLEQLQRLNEALTRVFRRASAPSKRATLGLAA